MSARKFAYSLLSNSSRRAFVLVFGAGMLAAVAVQFVSGSRVSATPVDVTPGLVQQTDLNYVGSFRLPSGMPDTDAFSFDYGGNCMTYNPAGNGGAGSLLMCGHLLYKKVAEIGIPGSLPGGSVGSLATAPLVHNFTDVLAGHVNDVSPTTTSNYIGGLMLANGKLIVTAYVHYDANMMARKSHFVASTDLDHPQLLGGPYEVGSLGAGWVAGSMVPVPAAFQTILGPYLTGQCCLSIIGRTSAGPTASVFDVNDLQVRDPLPSQTVLGYPITHANLGGIVNGQCVSGGADLFDCTASMGGMVFPTNSRSVLFFGRLGTGPFCYGPGTADASMAGQPDGEGGTFCYDPAATAKGGHAYPYVYKVWAYDANDLASVKAGNKRMWDVVPYSTWNLNIPVSATEDRRVVSVAYDAQGQRVFVATANGEGARPIVHVFAVATPAPSSGLCR